MKTLIVALLLISSVGYSKTLIVSDIDDTIKIAHVRNTWDMIWYSQVTTNAFKGMTETYGAVLNEDLSNNEPNSEVIYVTNADSLFMGNSHTEFIKKNHFPEGKIFFQKNDLDVDHKYNTIKSYLEKNSFDKLIMVGDNGQEDINFYSRITDEFKDKIFIRTYIRKVYGAPTEVVPFKEGQIPFVSPLEILQDLEKSGFISLESYYSVSNMIAQEIVDEKDNISSYDPQYFPKWLNCKDMSFKVYPELSTPQIEKAFNKVQGICQ